MNTSGDWSDDKDEGKAGHRLDWHRLEESENMVDFRVTSMDSSEKRGRHRPTWLPGISSDQRQRHKMEAAVGGGIALELSVAMSSICGSHAEDES